MSDELRKCLDSTNINFLIGSGLSRPYLDVLNGIEEFLCDKTKSSNEIIDKKKEYFEKVMEGNLKIVDNVTESDKDKVLNGYKEFYRTLNSIVLKRETSILNKQVNIFTTNIDVFSEMALEETGIEFNDGFHGRFNPIFNLGNFKKSYYKKSLHYENTSEIPVFNILKLHGSLTWKYDDLKECIVYDAGLQNTKTVSYHKSGSEFEEHYKKLLIVNPTKEKFGDTLLNQYYYDLLRIFSNELEKENSVLFVAGFSFADEHIRDLTIRVAASNPTLKIYIFVHSATNDTYNSLRDNAKNRNIELLLPSEGTHYDLPTITNEVFSLILDKNVSTIEEK